jgi:2-oxoglutarate ferredoxin oxidoreductase subunit gamma
MQHEIRLQGMRGQEIIAAGQIIGEAVSLHERKEALMTEDCGSYVVGGCVRADLIISDEPIDYPLVTKPEILVAMSQDGLDDNWNNTPKDAILIVDPSYVNPQSVYGRKVFSVPALSIAEKLGNKALAHIVMLGYLTAKTSIVSRAAMESAIADRYPNAIELNLQAFARGYELS